MPDSNESLILKEQAELKAAPFLFSNDDLPKIDKTKPKFHCTGERLWRDRPDVYKAVVKLLAEPGVSIRSICATLHVTDDTVRAVKERENLAIAAQKRTVLSNIAHGLRLASERVIEVLPSASAKDALLGVGILTDKMQLLSGEATERVEQVEHMDIFAHFQAFVVDLKKEVASKTGLRGGNNSPKGGDAEKLTPIIDVEPESEVAATDYSASSDTRSANSNDNSSVSQPDALSHELAGVRPDGIGTRHSGAEAHEELPL